MGWDGMRRGSLYEHRIMSIWYLAFDTRHVEMSESVSGMRVQGIRLGAGSFYLLRVERGCVTDEGGGDGIQERDRETR